MILAYIIGWEIFSSTIYDDSNDHYHLKGHFNDF